MCMKNNQPVNEYNSPCGSCPEYLNSCMPVVIMVFLQNVTFAIVSGVVVMMIV